MALARPALPGARPHAGRVRAPARRVPPLLPAAPRPAHAVRQPGRARAGHDHRDVGRVGRRLGHGRRRAGRRAGCCAAPGPARSSCCTTGSTAGSPPTARWWSRRCPDPRRAEGTRARAGAPRRAARRTRLPRPLLSACTTAGRASRRPGAPAARPSGDGDEVDHDVLHPRAGPEDRHRHEDVVAHRVAEAATARPRPRRSRCTCSPGSSRGRRRAAQPEDAVAGLDVEQLDAGPTAWPSGSSAGCRAACSGDRSSGRAARAARRGARPA